MKNKILLYHPKTSHEKNYKFFWIPYSLLSISAPLIDNGFDVEIIDGNLKNSYNKNMDDVLCIGVSSMIGHQIEDGIDFCKDIRQKTDAPIVWGGTFPTILPEIISNSEYVDLIVRGPGQHAFLDLINSLNTNSSYLSNLSNSGKITNFGEIQKLPKMNDLPPYPFELINLKNYVRDDPNISNRVINYISSQGCPFSCGFCTEVAVYKNKWNAYSASSTLDEVLNLTDKASANGVKFYDSNFFASPKRALDFAQGLIDNQVQLNWAASAHPRNLLNLNETNLQTLKKSGLSRLLIGAESGVQDELNFINKKLKVEEIKTLTERLEYHGIIGSFTFVTGYPTKPEENIDITINFAEKLAKNTKSHEYKIHLYLPFPGTPLFGLAVINGFQSPTNLEGWSNLDYYRIETPWIDKKYQKKVRDFNEQHCPYVL